ncbi:hypothetical protein HZC20_02245 [Candidatus Peregrinibacteria bacterium]|nr:hypothetical protein [Candidatus Peregrinibacteria bacterium]
MFFSACKNLTKDITKSYNNVLNETSKTVDNINKKTEEIKDATKKIGDAKDAIEKVTK